MTSNRDVATSFYKAFAARDGAAMAVAYSPDAEFSDPAFGDLRGRDIGDMWRMLCVRAKDLTIEFQIVEDRGGEVHVNWQARYTFAKTGRVVLNRIHATMTIQDGKIVKHRDQFSFWSWSAQALGPIGMLLGWAPFLQTSVRRTALDGLRAFQKSAKA